MTFCNHPDKSFTLKSRISNQSNPACKECTDNFKIMTSGLEDKYFVEAL